MLGVELGFMVYGSETRREPFSSTIPNVFVDVTTRNNFFLAHLLVRLQPHTGAVRPYLQGMVGLNYLYTRTSIENTGNVGEEIASSEDAIDNAFSYGGGVGGMIRVWSRDDEDTGGLEEVLIDLDARYVLGQEARYLKEGSIRIEGGAGGLRHLMLPDRPPRGPGRRLLPVLTPVTGSGGAGGRR